MIRMTFAAFLAWVCCTGSLAGVTCWSGDCGNASITGINITITGPGTFRFESVDGTTLEAIGEIIVADGVTGLVTVHIERSTSGTPAAGATTVDGIDLRNNMGASLTGDLAELRITGNLGLTLPTEVT